MKSACVKAQQVCGETQVQKATKLLFEMQISLLQELNQPLFIPKIRC